MANELLYGFTPTQYGQASNLGYSNQSFNALGEQGMNSALDNNTMYGSAFQDSTTAIPTTAPSYMTTDTGFGMSTPPVDTLGLDSLIPDSSAGYANYANNDKIDAGMGNGYKEGNDLAKGYENVLQNPATMNPGSWFEDDKYGQQLRSDYKLDSNGKPIQKSGMEMERDARTDMYRSQIDNMGSSASDWARVALGTGAVGIQAMKLPAQLAYLENSNKALEQQTANAEESHQQDLEATKSYGSAFSNA